MKLEPSETATGIVSAGSEVVVPVAYPGAARPGVRGLFRQPLERGALSLEYLADLPQRVADDGVDHVRPEADRRRRNVTRQAIDAAADGVDRHQRLCCHHAGRFEHIVCHGLSLIW